jgi:hypothetical protein
MQHEMPHDVFRVGPLPAEPTDAPVGSKAKLYVMHQRALRGEQLHHPADNRFCDPRLISPFIDNSNHANDYDGGYDNGLLVDPALDADPCQCVELHQSNESTPSTGMEPSDARSRR